MLRLCGRAIGILSVCRGTRSRALVSLNGLDTTLAFATLESQSPRKLIADTIEAVNINQHQRR